MQAKARNNHIDLGHEGAGVVVKVGKNVKDFKVSFTLNHAKSLFRLEIGLESR